MLLLRTLGKHIWKRSQAEQAVNMVGKGMLKKEIILAFLICTGVIGAHTLFNCLTPDISVAKQPIRISYFENTATKTLRLSARRIPGSIERDFSEPGLGGRQPVTMYMLINQCYVFYFSNEMKHGVPVQEDIRKIQAYSSSLVLDATTVDQVVAPERHNGCGGMSAW